MRGCVVITNQITQVRVRKSSFFCTCSGVAGMSFFFFEIINFYNSQNKSQQYPSLDDRHGEKCFCLFSSL